MEGGHLLKLVQGKLNEKDEIIHEQQRQIEELMERLSRAEGEALAHAETIAEKDSVIRELMDQLSAEPEPGADQDELVREQMAQIVELSERVESLEAELKLAQERVVEFDSLQAQLKELLGES